MNLMTPMISVPQLRRQKPSERRKTIRYAVKKTMDYCVTSGRSGLRWERGWTLDMSAGGLFVQIPDSLPIGATLTAKMDWSGLYHGVQSVRLFLTCSVVRVESRGTALRIVKHEFRGQGIQKVAEVA
jgi:hypothetical protein